MAKKSWLVVAGAALAALLVPASVVVAGGEGAKERGRGEIAGSDAQDAASETHIGTCTGISKISYAQSTTPVGTASTAYVNIPGGSVSFTTASTSCVAVDFAAEAYAPNNGLMLVRALLDGRPCPLSEDWQLSGDDDEDNDGRWARAHAYNCVFNPVAAGNHVLTMQYRSFFGGSVFLNDLGLQVHSRA